MIWYLSECSKLKCIRHHSNRTTALHINLLVLVGDDVGAQHSIVKRDSSPCYGSVHTFIHCWMNPKCWPRNFKQREKKKRLTEHVVNELNVMNHHHFRPFSLEIGFLEQTLNDSDQMNVFGIQCLCIIPIRFKTLMLFVEDELQINVRLRKSTKNQLIQIWFWMIKS